jgi:hypothetical protein
MNLPMSIADNGSMVIYFVYMVVIVLVSNLGLQSLEGIVFPEGRNPDGL